MVKYLLQKIVNQPLKDALPVKQTSIRNLIANVTIPLALLLVMNAASVQAAIRGKNAMNSPSLRPFQARPMVSATSTQATRMTLVRSGRRQAINMPVPSSGRSINSRRAGNTGGYGWMNPNLMVMTSQGLMHRERAERLGIPYWPYTGSPE